MNTIYYTEIQQKTTRFFVLMLFCLVGFTACNTDENALDETAYFTIEENPTGVATDVQGTAQSYVVRSNRPWKIVSQSEADWVRAFPDEGEDDGRFQIIVNENLTFDERTVNFAFVVDGEEQPVLFRVDQLANIPFIEVLESEDGIAIPSAVSEFSVNIKANVTWNYRIENGDWLSELNQTDEILTFTAEKNQGEERTAKLILEAEGRPSLTAEISLVQSAGDVILEENFDWLNYGDPVFYAYSGEKRMDSWTVEEVGQGWTSTPNEHSSNQQVVYARPGFVKLGKTGYGGDLISPKLAELDEPTDVRVTFKAVPYKTKGGTQDDNLLKVNAVGAGTANVNSFTVDNWPDYDTDPTSTEIWKEERTEYEFTITGATAETQVRFLGGDFYLKGVGKGKNRIFLDDIKVTIIPK